MKTNQLKDYRWLKAEKKILHKTSFFSHKYDNLIVAITADTKDVKADEKDFKADMIQLIESSEDALEANQFCDVKVNIVSII